MQRAYDDARKLGLSFEEQAEGEYDAMVNWVLGPFADPGYTAEFERKKAAATRGLMLGDRNAISKYVAVAERGQFAEALVEKYPDLTGRGTDFARSSEPAQRGEAPDSTAPAWTPGASV